MTGADVQYPVPLARLNPWYPGQMGVPGTDSETGIRYHCTGTIFYVDPNYPGATDQRDGTNPTDPMLTVEGAIGKCESYRGDVVVVMHNAEWQYGPGTPYGTGIQETVTIDKHGIRLVGVSNSDLGVPWQAAADDSYCIINNGIDNVIEGFMFHSEDVAGGHGIQAVWDGTTAYGENLTIRNCAFMDDLDIAINLDYTWYCHIHHCAFWEVDEYGIYCDSGGGAPTQSEPDYIVINDCFFYDTPSGGTGAAIWLPGLEGGHIHHNTVYNPTAQGAAAATNEGVVTNDGTVAGAQNMVWQNVFSCQNTAVANGDYGDLNSGSPTDAWTHSYCMNGLAYAIP